MGADNHSQVERNVQNIATWTNADGEEEAMNDDHAPLWQRMIALAAPQGCAGLTVLDYGCNQGGFLELLYNKAPFREAMGVDIALESVAFAKQRLARLPFTGGHPAVLADKKGMFDVAFSHEVLYLLPDLGAHAALMKSALRPGGVYFAAIGCHTDQPLWDEWRTLIASYSNVPVQDYSLDDYANAFFDAGFTVAAQPYRLDGFFPLKKNNPYFPKVADSLRYYETDKVLFRFENAR